MLNLTKSKRSYLPIASALITLLAGCASPESPSVMQVKKSVFSSEQLQENLPVTQDANLALNKPTKIERITSLESEEAALSNPIDELHFKDDGLFKVAFSDVKLSDLIHQVFGQSLKVNYVLEQKINGIQKNVTLNTAEGLTARKLYINIKQLLDENGVSIKFKDGVFYLYNESATNKRMITKVGRTIHSVPSTSGTILQIIPLKYGVNLSMERTLRQLVKANVSPDADQSAVFVQGSRDDIIQVIELIQILDRPANQGKHIGFLELNYISTDEFISSVSTLLENEGVPTGTKIATQRNLAMVPLHQIGAIAIFASELEFLERVEFWAKKLDKAPQGDTKQYFIYRPKYARAQDLGESLKPLFGGSINNNIATGNSNRDTKSAVNKKTTNTKAVGNNIRGDDDINIVVDTRANFVIFHTTGTKYQSILPLVRNLDVMPKQILLEVTIAEVTLRDEFQYGVEYFFQDGDFSFVTKGSLGLEDVSGALLSSVGAINNIEARLISRNNLVNVLSNPTLLVRDGTEASIIVGDEISVATSTDLVGSGNDVLRQNIDRRQTGLTLRVKPTINTKGVVIMEIEQSISNQIAGTVDDLLNREINTEVVANSGATILLGGLISENNSDVVSKVPLLGDIPLLGNLFKTVKEGKDKTELVVLVTPRVIYDQNQWHDIKNNFQKGVENIIF